MIESEISALLDAHDSLVQAYVESRLTFSEFVCAYGDFPHNYADISHDDADRFLPAVGLMRIRELLARYPDFQADAMGLAK